MNRILKQHLGRPRKVKKVYFLTKEQKQKRVEFCRVMLKKGIKGGQIFFSDETKIELGPNTNDSV